MTDDEMAVSEYWIDGPQGCPIGGPFDLWRPEYFRAHGVPPQDTVKLYPSLAAETINDLARAAVTDGATLASVLADFADRGPRVELAAAYRYFSEWRRRVPFMPDSLQDLPLLPARTEPQPLEEFLGEQ